MATLAELTQVLTLKMLLEKHGVTEGLQEVTQKAHGLGDVLGGALKVGAGLAAAGIGVVAGALKESVSAAMDAQRTETQLDAVLKSTAAAAEAEAAATSKNAAAKAVSVTHTKLSSEALAGLRTRIEETTLRHNTMGAALQEQRQRLIAMTASLGDNALAVATARAKLAESEQKYKEVGDTIDTLKGKLAAGSVTVTEHATSMVSAGQAARMTKDELMQLATTLGDITPVEDDTIVGMEAMLLTFTKIGKDTFPDATRAVLDMATAMSSGATPSAEQLKSTAVMVGKALQDPIVGATALRKVGVALDEQQREMIKTMVETGNVAGAQAIILKELQKEYGGSAEAAGKTLAGQMQILQNRIGNVKEDVGMNLIPILLSLSQTLGPVLVASAQKFADFLKDPVIPIIGKVVSWFTDNWPQIQAVTEQVFGAVQDAIETVFNALRPVVEGAIAAITSVLQGGQVSTEGFGQAWQQVKEVLDAVIPPIADTIRTILGDAQKFLADHGEQIKEGLLGAWNAIRGAVESAIQIVQSVIRTVFGAVATFLQSHGKEIGDFMSQSWAQISQIIKLAVDLINATIVPVFKAIAKFLGEHATEIQAVLDGVWKIIKGIIKTALDMITGILKAALLVFKGDWKGAWDAIKEMAGKVWDDIKGIFKGAVEILETLLSGAWGRIKEGAVKAWEGVRDGIVGAFSGIKRGIADILNDVIDRVNDLIAKLNKVPGVNIPEIKHLAAGTANWAGGLAMVGEYGPEMVWLPKGAQVWNSGETRQTLPDLAGRSGGSLGGKTTNVYNIYPSYREAESRGSLSDTIRLLNLLNGSTASAA